MYRIEFIAAAYYARTDEMQQRIYARSDFPFKTPCDIDRRMQPSDKVREILKEPGWTQATVAGRIGVSQSTVNRWLRGSQPEGANRDELNALYDEIFGGGREPKVPLKGYIGAGQAIYPFEDGGEELVEAPPRARASTVAARVRGDSMLPHYEDGDVIYYSRNLPPDEMRNRRCVVKLADGRLLVKTIRRGSSPNLWTLTSTNAADIEDVAVEWVAPIDWIKPR